MNISYVASAAPKRATVSRAGSNDFDKVVVDFGDMTIYLAPECAEELAAALLDAIAKEAA